MTAATKKKHSPLGGRRNVLIAVGVLAVLAFVLARKRSGGAPASVATVAADPAAPASSSYGGDAGYATGGGIDAIGLSDAFAPFSDQLDALSARVGQLSMPPAAPTPITVTVVTPPPADDPLVRGVPVVGNPANPQPVVTQPAAPVAPLVVPTATLLQGTVSKPNLITAVFPKVTEKPQAVKATANKTGASANKVQGVFAVH